MGQPVALNETGENNGNLKGDGFGNACVTDAASAATGEVTVGNILAPTTATIANLLTGLAASGYTTLLLKFKGRDGAVTNNPIVYFVVNAADPTTALGSLTTCRFIGINDEMVINFSSIDPLGSLDIYPVGTMTNTILAWEYK